MTRSERPVARLMLENGSIYTGHGIGVPGTTFGELVFNTAATGYQEVLTDPSYTGQVVLLTSPEIGNYGINHDDYESERIHVAGLVVKRLSPFMSSWRAQISLQEFLVRNGIVGIEGVDTRAITLKIREHGAMKVGITTEDIPDEEFLAQIKAHPGMGEQDFIGQVTTPKPYSLSGTPNPDAPSGPRLERLAVVDFGIKQTILHYLRQYAKEVVVLPATVTFEEIRSYRPEGVLLSNGPGDPSVLIEAVDLARQLIDSRIPTFGICLGHQILGLACGARVSKMRFGHHGGNHPVKDLETGQITITSQNHGYAVQFDDFPEETLKVTHINLNDNSIEGVRHLDAPVLSVQFHPEASPGPQDSRYIFGRFVEEVLTAKSFV